MLPDGRSYGGAHARVLGRDRPPRDAAIPSAAELSWPAAGRPVRCLGAINVPGEETCFCLYQAPSAGAVREAMTRAELRPERIAQALSIGPPQARPDRSVAARGPAAGPPQHDPPQEGRCR